MIEWLGKGQPIACIGENTVLCYSNSIFEILNTIDNSRKKLCMFKQKRIYRLFERISLMRRLLRMEIRCGYLINSEYYFFKYKSLYYLNINTGRIYKLYDIPQGWSAPLNISKGFGSYKILWGAYGSNSGLQSVHIMGLTKNGGVEVLYRFPAGTIRHIHNLIKDDENNGYYIFTGDHGNHMGIYYSDITFTNIVPVLTGNQQHRAVQGFPTKDGIVYATDAVEEVNCIYYAHTKDRIKWELTKICGLNGSCIYGTRVKQGYVFSTTVEPSESKEYKKTIRNLLSMKRAKGILSNSIDVIYLKDDLSFSRISTFEKDNLPYKLFQYGALRFAVNSSEKETVFFYPVAIKHYDGMMGYIRLD